MQRKSEGALLALAGAALAFATAADAATRSATFRVSATVQSDCTSTSGAAYQIALNPGTASGSTIEVPTQSVPASGTCSDTVTVTITY